MARRHRDTRADSIDKTFFDLSKGFLTELTPLGRPGGSTVEESNFEILRDSTRRRRRGLNLEFDNAPIPSVLDFLPQSKFAWHRWQSVANNPNLHFIVVRIGSTLHFYAEEPDLAGAKLAGTVSLNRYSSYGEAYGSELNYGSEEDVSLSSMHGRLFVAGSNIEPFYVEYNEDDDEFTVGRINIRIRDLYGIEDGVPVGTKPKTLSDDHRYNLANRGWGPNTWDRFNIGRLADGTNPVTKGYYPAKNMIWWKAMVRWAGAGNNYQTGITDIMRLRKFDTNAIEAEVFGSTSAPQGHLFLNPFNTAVGYTDDVEDEEVDRRPVTNWECIEHENIGPTADGYKQRMVFRLTFNNSSPSQWLNGQDLTLTGARLKFLRGALGGGGSGVFELDGYQLEVGSSTTTSIRFQIFYVGQRWTSDEGALIWDIESPGYLTEGGSYTKSTGYVTSERPRCVATFGGRVFYAGVNHPELADIIFYSQVGNSTKDGAASYRKMYQEGDPTGEYLNLALPSDGGTLQVPGLAGVVGMVPMGSGLLILAQSGVWELTGSRGEYFSGTSHQIRKVTDAEVNSVNGWAKTDSGIVFASPRGLYLIAPNQYTGELEAQSLTYSKVQTYWQDIYKSTNADIIQVLYDPSLYKIYVLYREGDNSPTIKGLFNKALVYDLVYSSFYKLSFPSSIVNGFIHGAAMISNITTATSNRKLKFFVLAAAVTDITIRICDLDQTTFVDWDGTEQIPFIETGYDGVGEQDVAPVDHTTPRTTDYVHVYLKRTETGYEEVGEDVVPINPSSLYMEGRWGFTDNSVSGKVGTQQQVYRKQRQFLTDAAPSVNDGNPIIITKSRVRGRGKSLHLKFIGEAGYDAHLLGYAIEYKPET